MCKYVLYVCQQIPLVEGYSTLITQLQLDEVIDCSGASPTKMIRNLLMVYFPPQTLAKSSCFGGRKFPALDKQIIGACLSESLLSCSKPSLILHFYPLYRICHEETPNNTKIHFS